MDWKNILFCWIISECTLKAFEATSFCPESYLINKKIPIRIFIIDIKNIKRKIKTTFTAQLKTFTENILSSKHD